MTDDEPTDDDEQPSQADDGNEKDDEPKVEEKEVVIEKREWNSKEEAKQAFKDLLREKVCRWL